MANIKNVSIFLLAVLIAVLVSTQIVVDVRAHTSHDNITEDALKGEFTPEALKEIIKANEGQDAVLSPPPDNERRHFDRKLGEDHGVAFNRSKTYILEELNEMETKLSGSPSNADVRAALQAFGRLLHTLQDLTSHSNYITLSAEDQAKVFEAILDCTKQPPAPLQLTSYLTITADILEKLWCGYRIDTPSHGKEGLDDNPTAVDAAKNLTRRMETEVEKRIGKDKKDLMKKWKPPVKTNYGIPSGGGGYWPGGNSYSPPKCVWGPAPQVPILTTDGYLPLSITIPVANQFGLPLFISPQGMFDENILNQIIALGPKFVTMVGENDTVLPLYKECFDALGIVNVLLKGDYQDMSVGLYNLFNDERMGQIPIICDYSHPILSKSTTPIYVSNITGFELLGEVRFRNVALISNYGTAKTLAEVAVHLYPELVTYDVTQEASEVYAFIDVVKQSAQNGYVSPEALQGAVDSYLYPIEYIAIPEIVDAYPLSESTGIPVTVNVEIAFSKPMNKVSVQQAVTISPCVDFEFSWFESIAVLIPQKLDYGTTYTVTIKTTAEDLGGNHLTDIFRITFTTTSGVCFIATAAHGTPMAEEIQILRNFRDEYLLTNPVGEALVGLYYRVSPPIAEFITEHPSLKPIVRVVLVPAVAMSTVALNTTPAEKIAIIGLVALVSVALTAWATRRRGRGVEYT
jgi:hypothetical protein